MKVYENILISSLTTMRIGGPARYVLEIAEPKDIPEAYGFAEAYWLPTFILGGGANTIGHDEGFNGVILLNRLRGFNDQGGILTIAAGEPWDSVVAYACEKGYTGIEALSKIPGLTGAAPVQNIGAYGQDLSQTFESATAYDTVTRGLVELGAKDLDFSYRKSALNTTKQGRFFITSVTLRLKQGQMPRPFYNSIEAHIEENHLTDFSPKGLRDIVTKIRADKLPDPSIKPSAGSFFKNVYLDDRAAEAAIEKGYPVHRGKDGNKINAGWLIEQVGLKGQLLHGIRINDKAALNLINESAGTYENLAKARGEIASAVYDKFGYWLEQEPVEIIDTKDKGAPK
ncbi:UDP-N-acetylmuramate dehydrogenase [Candidatus Saccharibacteria bacterium]|nr:UDP-N-acetylmuramate dehydrogenase [Candidatus Saccharibacteria bacterium]